MKVLASALFFVSLAAQANYLDATVALKEVLPVGTYSGVDLDDERCSVDVMDTAGGVNVTVYGKGKVLNRVVPFSSVFRWQPGKREFLSTSISRNGVNSDEDVLRTVAVEENTQYVIVAKIATRNRDVLETSLECVVDL